MKVKKIIVFSILLWNIKIQAQDSISNSIIPKIGQTCVFVDFDSSLFRYGEAGKNVSWDFKNIQTGDTYTLYYVDPAKTPYYHHYPLANMAMTTDNQLFDYFLFTDSAYYSLGSAGCNSQTKSRKMSFYVEMLPTMKFPLKLGDSITQIENRFTRIFDVFDIYQTIKSTTSIDGSGTLFLNGHTYYNAIRFKQELKYLDFITDGNRYMTQEQIQIKYLWLVNEFSAPILSVDKSSKINKEDTSNFFTNQLLITPLAENADYPFPFYLYLDTISNEYVFNYNAIKSEKVKLIIRNNKGKKLAKTIKLRLTEGNNIIKIPFSYIESEQEDELYEFKLKGKGVNETYFYNKFTTKILEKYNPYFRDSE